MKTNLRIVKKKVVTLQSTPYNGEESEVRFAIHRGYYDDKGNEVAVSEEPVLFSATSPLKLRAMVAAAFKLPIVDLTDDL